MTVPGLSHGTKIWAVKKKQKAKIDTAEVNFFRRIEGYIKADEIINIKIMYELNIFNLSARITKS
jgi:hypothetical protein